MNAADQLEHYRCITQKLNECMDENGNILTEKFGEAALLFAPVYDWIFSFGIVAKHLQKDIIGHATSVIDTARISHDYYTIDSLIQNTLKTSTLKEIRKTGKNGIVDLLWTKRCIHFITKFLSYGIVEHTDKSLHSCASMAYEEILKPYHGIMISTFVSLAFSMVTSREKFIKQLGFTNIKEAQAALDPFLKASIPVVLALNDLLERYECNFPDKA